MSEWDFSEQMNRDQLEAARHLGATFTRKEIRKRLMEAVEEAEKTWDSPIGLTGAARHLFDAAFGEED